MATCTPQPIPKGWQVWQGPVPDELARLALDVRDHIGLYHMGQLAQVTIWKGEPIAAYASKHTWAYKGGVLKTGLCVPGVALLRTLSGVHVVGEPRSGQDASTTPMWRNPVTSLTVPDPSLAVWEASGPTTHMLGVIAKGLGFYRGVPTGLP